MIQRALGSDGLVHVVGKGKLGSWRWLFECRSDARG